MKLNSSPSTYVLSKDLNVVTIFLKSYHPVPCRDSISRPIHTSSLLGGRRRQYHFVCKYVDHAARALVTIFTYSNILHVSFGKILLVVLPVTVHTSDKKLHFTQDM
jgi:hypothetical protein